MGTTSGGFLILGIKVEHRFHGWEQSNRLFRVENPVLTFLFLSSHFQEEVYYTIRVMSVEVCRRLFSPIFAWRVWYF